MSGWIGVDFDRTLAKYDKWAGGTDLGEPVPAMLARVLGWIAEGKTVKIFTARACFPELIPPVKEWLIKHGLGDLEITNVKDFGMIELWDDRAIGVIPNTGVRADGLPG